MSRFDTNKVVKDVKFMDLTVSIRKLTVGQVLDVQEKAKALNPAPLTQAQVDAGEKLPEISERDNISLLTYVIKSGVAEMSEFTDAEFLALPMDELSKLSTEIMKFSGLVK